MDMQELLAQARLDGEALETFIAAGWLMPRRQGGAPRFTEIDLVRACLIRDLQHDLGVNADGIAIILDLLDQMHGLRRTLRDLLAALGAQPAPTRARIVAEVRAVVAERAAPPARARKRAPRPRARKRR